MLGLVLALIAGGVALGFAGLLAMQVLKQDEGTEGMIAIGQAIREGAQAFLVREYRFLAVFVAGMTGILIFLGVAVEDQPWEAAISYVAGAACSGIAGLVGMNVAVRANTRTAAAAMRALNPALRVAFSSGGVMGITVVGIGLLGTTILWLVYQDPLIVAGFSFGASSVALFARVGGGIYTKAADVGADLAGKVEAGIPEDDPRNPAVIADNVGDNVGDVAGMGADLFESYVGAIIGSLALASTAAFLGAGDGLESAATVLPFLVAAAGIVASILGTFLVRTNENANMGTLLWAIRRGIFGATLLGLAFTFVAIWWWLTIINSLTMTEVWKIFGAVAVGLGAGVLIGLSTEYFTSYENRPTQKIASRALTGPATVIISGMATGMLSTGIPVLLLVAAIIGAHELAGVYGVGIAAIGMLSTLGITLATDAYGPVADNAGGIAEQAHLDPKVRERTDALDSLGNTTAATGKGFAIGSAVLTSLALMSAYAMVVDLKSVDLLQTEVLAGLLIGALMPFVFSALSMEAVGKAAQDMVEEVRRQFREIEGLREGKEGVRADYRRCVDISTAGALRQMILPGLLAVTVPIIVGVTPFLGTKAVAGLLIGAIASGVMLAITMANAGGAWDNAKKYIEAGNHGGKGSEPHKAAVVGDTVGDPFKDTAGPSLNILIKLMSIVALTFSSVFVG
jgi:K(+)-stimulated pyrophosphate-energized sodium pump